MSSKDSKAHIYIQGRCYKPEEIDVLSVKSERPDIPIGSNPDKKHDENAFCKCIDHLIESRKLYTKEGILIGKRVGANFYDEQGKLIKNS